MGVCEEILLWSILKEPQFQVPLMYTWRYLVSRPYQFFWVRRGVMERGDTCDERGRRGRGTAKGQGSALLLLGNDSDSDILSQGTATALPTEGHDHSGAKDVYHEWHSGQKRWHVCALIRPPYTCAQCKCKQYLWCTHYGGCAFCLTTTDCPTRGGVTCDTDRWVHLPADWEPTMPPIVAHDNGNNTTAVV